ncbi:hypothetical protein [Pseudoalteromonas tunicata]|jgi:hypothetical protein|uniref:PilZ domain-containing protein n=1 Tax=Pseudoalteromonas tunicata D2 TaxID=87626 RepID=A4CC18_9GAMM|nr:hypothetical protein [Pseudoalteromonas tunicata]ATC94453.1 hypothetical protein PTUN_a1891 [Pseudoalteromonas tunicata]AXT30184.1 PilZ domain-containing protein [Pseudoalteromonas tunicata]EAR27905.1 hypothetical protein PTD2_18825 [Pseudoalteromonas tunicata D2]MDP4983436.1 PilZ domain-containing protein [Pseudoalteromonas tunicata]MDP5211669.1 PilZ domain-containing protein [Pseudoalteromonas tunicata]
MSTAKVDLFNQYFQIDETVDVNLKTIADHLVPIDNDALELRIPPLFKLANEVNALEQSALRPLRQLGDLAEELAQFLKAQSRKIDLIMAHILATEHQDEQKTQAHSFGGGGLILNDLADHSIGQQFCTKIFLHHEAAAVFCYTEVILKEPLTQGWQYTMAFSRIRPEDQELMVRASLHSQSRQLRKRRKNEQN